ncbi:stressosome-associated protein Prli42 [Kurthia senegalensis]|nr:stressosome-associated protein Prli42 [Kurthia senegalensis]
MGNKKVQRIIVITMAVLMVLSTVVMGLAVIL